MLTVLLCYCVCGQVHMHYKSLVVLQVVFVFIYPCFAHSLCGFSGVGAAVGAVGVVCTGGEKALADE